jgi:hypothetical protein
MCLKRKEVSKMQTAIPSLGMHMFVISLYHLFVLLLNIQWTLFSFMELVMGCCLKLPHLGVLPVL